MFLFGFSSLSLKFPSFQIFVVCCPEMSASSAPCSQPAVAVKSPRKRPRESSVSGSRYDEEFRGCRDSPSPTRPGSIQRASKSRPMHHRILVENLLMHRHELEWQLEELWDNHGIEYKFLRSTGDMSTLEFYGGLSSSAASATEPSSSVVFPRGVMMVQPNSTSSVPTRIVPKRASHPTSH